VVSNIPDNAAPFLLLATFRGMVDELHRRLGEEGFPDVTASQGLAMQAMGEGCTGIELAQRLGVSKQAAARTIQTLHAANFAERVRNPQDRREHLVKPSANGRRMLAASGKILSDLVKEWRERAGDHNVSVTLTTLANAQHGSRPWTHAPVVF
jgi:DNA-binding MarR family transcriptional regulator